MMKTNPLVQKIRQDINNKKANDDDDDDLEVDNDEDGDEDGNDQHDHNIIMGEYHIIMDTLAKTHNKNKHTKSYISPIHAMNE